MRKKENLQATIISLQGNLSSKDIEIANKDASFIEERGVLQGQIDSYKTEIEKLQASIDEKQSQLNDRELKKLAQAYGDQELAYQKDTDKWFLYLRFCFLFVAISFGLSLWLGEGRYWYDKIEYHVINFLTVTALVFAMRQFSHFNKLRIDFANRKAIAQAYHNIFTSTDDEVIKEKFLDEVIKILCAKSDYKPEANTLPEKLLEDIKEFMKNSNRV